MYEPKVDILSLSMLFGLALGLAGYLVIAQGIAVACGLGLGYLIGIILERVAGSAASVVEEWPALGAQR